MKKTIILSCLLSLFSFASYANSSSETLDSMAAVVNDDVITQSELKHAIKTTKVQLTQQNMAAPSDNMLKKQVLDQLILKKLQLQIAKQVGVEVSDSELDNTIKNIATQNQITVENLYQRINQEGMSSTDYRNEMRDQMTLQKLQQQEVASKISITPQEVQTFMHSRAWQSSAAKEYQLQDILVPVSDTPSSEELASAKKRADELVNQLHQGKSFQSVAQTESSDPNALQGGDLGWRKLSEIPTAFSDTVVKMNKNDISNPIQTPNGFHILKLTNVRGTHSAMPDRKTIEAQLLQQKFEEAVKNWVSKIRGQAFIVKNEIA